MKCANDTQARCVLELQIAVWCFDFEFSGPQWLGLPLKTTRRIVALVRR